LEKAYWKEEQLLKIYWGLWVRKLFIEDDEWENYLPSHYENGSILEIEYQNIIIDEFDKPRKKWYCLTK
jgi:hypothetical protein